MDENCNLSGTLLKSIEIQNKSLNSILGRQTYIQKLMAPMLNNLPSSSSAISALTGCNQIAEKLEMKPILRNTMILQNATSTLCKSMQQLTFNDSVWRKFYANTTAVLDSYRDIISGSFTTNLTVALPKINAQIAASPALRWIHSIDFSPWLNALKKLHIGDDFIQRFLKMNDICLIALYECKWFPYASWSANIELTKEIYKVLSTSRGASKRREKRINKLILGYYTPKRIKEIEQTWRDSDLEKHIKKILGQALGAHLRGEYALSIACLSTMWEGLIHHKLHIKGRYSQRKTGRDFTDLIKANDLKPIFGEFYENLIVCDCNTVEEVVEGIPNRNGVSHSKYKEYPNKKASLNAILITDFIIHLEPKQEMEELSDGQIENA